MTMAECIEQRKTTLSGVVEAALQSTIHGTDAQVDGWGIEVEVARVAQVFIVDAQLRQQLEAEVRNEIKLKSDRSGIRSQEEIRLAELASDGRVQERKLAADRDVLRREEEMELARLARQRRMETERLATDQQARRAGAGATARPARRGAGPRERGGAGPPPQDRDRERILREELDLRRLQNQVKALEVEADLLLERARQELRLEMLPVEQAPRIVEAASSVLHGTNLSIYGEGGQLLNQLAPVFELLTRSMHQANGSREQPAPEPVVTE